MVWSPCMACCMYSPYVQVVVVVEVPVGAPAPPVGTGPPALTRTRASSYKESNGDGLAARGGRRALHRGRPGPGRADAQSVHKQRYLARSRAKEASCGAHERCCKPWARQGVAADSTRSGPAARPPAPSARQRLTERDRVGRRRRGGPRLGDRHPHDGGERAERHRGPAHDHGSPCGSRNASKRRMR